jgi:Peptidase propeptide and YPEB domain
MNHSALFAALICLAPISAAALPAVGDAVGTNADDARAALAALGCEVQSFELEDGQIEAYCTDDDTGATWEVYIDPTSGLVAEVKAED